MVISDDKVLFIPVSTTLAPKLVDPNVLFSDGVVDDGGLMKSVRSSPIA
jgi:hypothetical protein